MVLLLATEKASPTYMTGINPLSNHNCPFVDGYTELYIDKLEHSSQSTPAIHLLKYELEAYSDSCYAEFDIDVPNGFRFFLKQRRAQYLAGRLAASNAMQTVKQGFRQVRSGENHQPIWPLFMSGSISHASNFSIATVIERTTHSQEQYIGLDIEQVLKEEQIASIEHLILTLEDRILFKSGIAGLDRKELFTLIFSAKESFFKATYPHVKRYFDFTDVHLCGLDLDNHYLTLQYHGEMSDSLVMRKKHRVSFDRLSLYGRDYCLSYCEV